MAFDIQSVYQMPFDLTSASKGAGQTMKAVWILGAGKFGRLATLRLSQRYERTQILVVDHDPRRLADLPCRSAQADAVEWLTTHLRPSQTPDMIVPAVPIHLAYHFLAAKLESKHFLSALPLPASIRRLLPYAFDGQMGQAFISNADFLCPDDCPEPRDHCPVTGKPRPRELFRYMQALDVEILTSIVIRSFQLAPGVGGYPPRVLFEALKVAVQAQGRILLSTACRCHGVSNFFEISSKQLRES
jgi:hypothetical protein